MTLGKLHNFCGLEFTYPSWKKSYDQPRQHIKKQRHYFANKGPSSQSCGFSSSHVWMWDKESWALKNWCFWTVSCWRRLLRVPWTAKRSNQSILKKISLNVHRKDWCWNWNSNTLATWWAKSFEKTLILGNIEGRRRRGQQRMRWLDGITDSMDMSLGRLRECILRVTNLFCYKISLWCLT